MSNPGLITLIEKRISGMITIKIEDNLGESVHIHYNGVRFDLTIKELLELSDICDTTIYELIKAENFKIDDFDDDFLFDLSECLMDLEKVTEKSFPMSELRYLYKYKTGFPIIRSMNRYKLAHSDISDKHLPVIINGKPILVYGEQQAFRQHLINPHEEIKVLDLCFESNKHTPSDIPWMKFLFSWNKRRLKLFAYKIAKKLL